MGVESGRDRRIDWIKASAIATVPLIHAGPEVWSPRVTATDLTLRYSWTAFAVPAFLMMSGRLYRGNGEPISWSRTWERMQRVLVPYLVCCSILHATAFVPVRSVGDLLFRIATGSTYGIYYYVPVLLFCIGASWVLSRASRKAIVTLLVMLAGYAFAFALMVPAWWSTFWLFRDPFAAFWLGFFVIGWLDGIAFLAHRVPRVMLIAALVAYLALWSSPSPTAYVRIPYAVAVVVLLWTIPLEFPGMRFLSDASFVIYLWHFPIQVAMRPLVEAWPPAARIFATWSVSLLGAVGICLAARACLGRARARFWIGA